MSETQPPRGEAVAGTFGWPPQGTLTLQQQHHQWHAGDQRGRLSTTAEGTARPVSAAVGCCSPESSSSFSSHHYGQQRWSQQLPTSNIGQHRQHQHKHDRLPDAHRRSRASSVNQWRGRPHDTPCATAGASTWYIPGHTRTGARVCLHCSGCQQLSSRLARAFLPPRTVSRSRCACAL